MQESISWFCLLPPLVAIVLAFVLRQTMVALLCGVIAGAWLLEGSVQGIFPALGTVVDTYLLEALHHKGHLSILFFSMLIGGMVVLVSVSGGMKGLVKRLEKFAGDRIKAQKMTWLMGVLIFFDDYANTLIVGNTMKPLTDRYRISREKLAYIVDSTAAPIAAIALVTTWIGAELGYIEDALGGNSAYSVYELFLHSLKYAYYPVLTLAMVLVVILFAKDAGPMLRAEKRAMTGARLKKKSVKNEESDALMPEKGMPEKARAALIPVSTLILVTIAGLLITGTAGLAKEIGRDVSFVDIFYLESGSGSHLGAIMGAADAYKALLWGSFAGVLIAAFVSRWQGMKLEKIVDSIIQGMKLMMPALIILVLAWGLAAVMEELGTAEYLAGLLKEQMNPQWLPVSVFILAAVVSFATGSSWGTMAILYPLVLPLASNLAGPDQMIIMFQVIHVVLGGAIFGDHCSPISDTTILSSMACGTPVIEHVRTQLPYALIVAVFAILLYLLPVFLAFPWWLGYLAGIGFIIFMVGYSGLFKKLKV